MRAIITHLGTSKKLSMGLALIVAAALVATMVGYTTLTRTVTLTVDGKSQSIRTFGSDVESVLASEGIDVSEHDAVLPSLDSQVGEGTEISVRFGRKLVVDVDGAKSTHWTTATRVESALRDIGVRASRGTQLSASRGATIDRSGMTLRVTTPKRLTIVVGDQKPRVVNLAVRSPQSALKEVGVKVDRDDIVRMRTKVKGDHPVLANGDKVTFIKVDKQRKRVNAEPIPFEIIEKPDSSMYEDEDEVEREGIAGARNVVYDITLHNGDEVKRKAVWQQALRAPVAKVVRVGTKERPEAPSVGFGVWDRLAECESGGNWQANTGNGYYGGVQFSASTWASVGGSGLPHQHSREEQIKRAQILQQRAGWGQWPHCSAELGLR